jgi:phosphate transport system substrate-binding protein
VSYQSIGSGGGIAAIKAQSVDFGISDAPLKPRDLQKAATVKPDAHSFQAAAADANWATATDFDVVITESPGAEAWPIAATSFVLMSKAAKGPARSRAALDFFHWALTEGQRQASELDYVSLPSSLVSRVEAYWKTSFGPSN